MSGGTSISDHNTTNGAHGLFMNDIYSDASVVSRHNNDSADDGGLAGIAVNGFGVLWKQCKPQHLYFLQRVVITKRSASGALELSSSQLLPRVFA